MQNLEKLSELAKNLPEASQEKAIDLVQRMGEVIEGFGDKPLEWKPELFKMVQGTSDRSKLPKGANIGSFVLGEDIIEKPFRVIPIRTGISRQYWNPDPEQAQMLCSSPDGERGFQYGDCRGCQYSKFDEAANKSQCNKTLTVLCISETLDRVFTVNFSKTNYMSGIDWQTTMKKAGVAPYKRIYTLNSLTSTKSKNVELIKAEPAQAPGNRVEGPLLAFVEEISRLSSEDRKESLKKFGEYIEMKKARGQELLAAPADVLLDASQSEFPTAVSVEALPTDVPETVASDIAVKKTGKPGAPNYKF